MRAASDALLSSAERHLAQFTPVAVTPSPEVGCVRFYLRTFGGTSGAEAHEQALGEGRHALSPVFYAAHAVITAIREATPHK